MTHGRSYPRPIEITKGKSFGWSPCMKQNNLLLQGGREVNREGERNYKESMSTLSPDGCKTIEESATDVTSLTANDYLCDQYTTHDMDLYTLVSL